MNSGTLDGFSGEITEHYEGELECTPLFEEVINDLYEAEQIALDNNYRDYITARSELFFAGERTERTERTEFDGHSPSNGEAEAASDEMDSPESEPDAEVESEDDAVAAEDEG